MAIRELLSSVVSRPAGRLLEGSVRTLVEDLVRDHDLASAAEVDALRRNLRALEGRADGLQAGLDAAQAALGGLQAALATSEQRLAETAEALASAEARLAEARATDAAVAPAPAIAAEPAHCRVPGCEGKHRSKGFCSPHYQRWRRGTLAGFVGLDGAVDLDGRRARVSPDLAGLPCAFEGDALLVDGKPVA